jgi:hypothetical protein
VALSAAYPARFGEYPTLRSRAPAIEAQATGAQATGAQATGAQATGAQATGAQATGAQALQLRTQHQMRCSDRPCSEPHSYKHPANVLSTPDLNELVSNVVNNTDAHVRRAMKLSYKQTDRSPVLFSC